MAVLVGLFLVAAAYHAFQSRAHLTPAIFGDELLYSKLAQGLAAGEGFVVRDVQVYFPAPLASIVQAPAWLVPDVSLAYAFAKALNAVVMASAVFPAYWLARQLVAPLFALFAAAAAASTPALVYHSYLLSEALAYPVFFLALATMARALANPGRRWELAVVGVSLLTVGTRTQFVVLPLAYLLAVPLASRLRAHRLSVGAIVVLAAITAAVTVATGGRVAGTYLGALSLEAPAADMLHWAAATAVLLPFAAGWLVVPGALLGFALLLRGPRADRGFAILAGVVTVLLLLQAGMIAALDAERPLERYTIYAVPLLFVAFFAYVERGAPGRRLYAGLALALGLLAWLVPFPSLADYLFSFDSPTLSAYGTLADWLGNANAATVFAAAPLSGSVAIVFLCLRRRETIAVAGASLAVLLLVGALVYAGDHAMSKRASAAWSAPQPDWLNQIDGEADYLALPGASPYFGWTLEAWSRNFGRPAYLEGGRPETDPFPTVRASIDRDGRLLFDGASPSRRFLVVGDYGSRIELDAEVVRRPRAGLTAYRLDSSPRVRSLAIGLYHDGLATGVVYQVWPAAHIEAGLYRVELALPRWQRTREVTLEVEDGARRSLTLAPGERATVELAARGYPVPPLQIRTDSFDVIGDRTPNPRSVSVRVLALSYRPAAAAT